MTDITKSPDDELAAMTDDEFDRAMAREGAAAGTGRADITKPLPDDDELEPDVRNDPVPEPAQPEDDATEPQEAPE